MIMSDMLYSNMIRLRENKVYSSYCLSVSEGNDIFSWHNPDEQFNVRVNIKTREVTGQYYEWDDEKEEWIDGQEMSEDDLICRIKNEEFILV